MASLQFKEGHTIHSWSGIGDGHWTRREVLQNILTNNTYAATKRNILDSQVLVIDEIGLVSCKIFNDVEYICRGTRRSNKLFGGLQVIASGSFTQLPPVPSKHDEGKYCFESTLFKLVFPHRIILNEVQRQKEQDLITAINELCLGSCSPETIDLLKSLNRPLPPYINPIYIYGTNVDVNFHNEYELAKLPTNPTVYRANDVGDLTYLKKCTAPYALRFKVGCKGIVIRNMTNGLMNGMGGTITELDPDCITFQVEEDPNLHHTLQGKEYKIERHVFIERNASNKIVALRKQFPLKLGYAVTVDKAQGRSIPYLVCDVYNFWKPGQFGVAVGRAITKDGLQIVNYNRSATEMPHSSKVSHFYATLSHPMQRDKTCCSTKVNYINIVSGPATSHNNYDYLQNMDNVDLEVEGDIDVQFILDSICPNAMTSFQKEKRRLIETFQRYKCLQDFVKKQFQTIATIFETYRYFKEGKKCN